MAVLHSNMQALTDRRGIIYGDKGYLVVENINNCEAISAYDRNRVLIKQYEIPEQITGYEYEVEACRKAIERGAVECGEMPLADSIAVMELVDRIKEILGSVYARQIEWAEREGYENSNALYEVYVTDPTEVSKESELVTEVYYPVKKRVSKD